MKKCLHKELINLLKRSFKNIRENDVSYHLVIPNSRSRCLLRTPDEKIIQKSRHGCRNDKIDFNKQDVHDEICSEDHK
jgi:hypothetical protein